MTTTTTTALPKNKTGLFAGNTLQDVKPTRSQSNLVSSLPPPYRHLASANLLLTPRNGSQANYPIDGNNTSTISTANDSCSTTSGIRNAFRPSSIRRQKSRVATASTHRENSPRDLRENSAKPPFISSPASARLKSEIDQINSQLKTYGDINKILALQHTRDTSSTSQSALSYTTSNRLSSASTNRTASRMHQRFLSSLTNETCNTLLSIPGMTDTSVKSIVGPSSPLNGEYIPHHPINHQITHAFQIPQQSNIGNESIFPQTPPSTSTNETRSAKTIGRFREKKTISCPFYIMYFTNLAIQQRPNNNHRVHSSVSTVPTRKGRVNPRLNSSDSRHQPSRKHAQSPISVNTYSTIDDDNDSLINTTSYYHNKRFSAKITAFENENSHMLKDLLRTTSWNHVQV